MAKGKSIREQKEDARRRARQRTREVARGGAKKKLSSVIFMSLITAGIGTALSVLTFRVSLTMGADVDPDLQSLVVMLGFIIIFLASILIYLKKYMAVDLLSVDASLPGSKTRGSKGYKPPGQSFGGALRPSTERFNKVFDDTSARRVAEPMSLDGPTSFGVKETAAAPPVEVESPADFGAGPAPPPSPAIGVGPQGQEPATEPDAAEGSKLVSDETMAKVLDDIKVVIVAVSNALQERGDKINAHARFGLNLFFAGVCARMTKHFSLSAVEGQGLLARLMELTGATAEFARSFSGNINSYGNFLQYRRMIDMGDSFMTHHLEATDEPGPDPGVVLDEWIANEGATPLPAEHTFMFTQIVDAKALTEEIGAVPMREVVNAHDEAVRASLGNFSGKEIKHTGDGIMALFDDPRAAIDAAVQMQQEMNLFSREQPQYAFDTRIGLHIGEAVEEDGDFVGETIKMAALVCAEAGAEEIWASEDVWRACPYYADDLKYCGEFTLKSIEKDQMLYMMLWEPIPDRSSGKVGYSEIGGN